MKRQGEENVQGNDSERGKTVMVSGRENCTPHPIHNQLSVSVIIRLIAFLLIHILIPYEQRMLIIITMHVKCLLHINMSNIHIDD